MRQVAIGMLVIGALLLVPAAFGRSWWLAPLRGGGVGLLALEGCDMDGENCKSVSHSNVIDETEPGKSKNKARAFVWSGRVTFAADLLAALAAGFMVFLLSRDDLARARRHPPLASIAASIALLASVLFLWTRPRELDPFEHGRAMYFHFLGLALVLFGEQLGLRAALEAPLDDGEPPRRRRPWAPL